MRRNQGRRPDLQTQLDEVNEYIEELEDKPENIAGIVSEEDDEDDASK